MLNYIKAYKGVAYVVDENNKVLALRVYGTCGGWYVPKIYDDNTKSWINCEGKYGPSEVRKLEKKNIILWH